MSSGPSETELARLETFALGVAHGAGEILIKHFGNVAWGYKKQVGKYHDQVVTRADKESEALIRKRILSKYPTHNILGEEEGLDDRGSEWTWVCDPLDGTRNFASGYLYWGVSIGLLYQNVPVVGVIHLPPFKPYKRDMFSAHRGGGFRLNGQKKRDPLRKILDPARIYSWGTPTIRETDISRTPTNLGHRLTGAAVTDFTEVLAGGSLGFILTDVFLHDIAAGMVMLEEAGGELLRYGDHNKRWSRNVIRFSKPSVECLSERYVLMGGHPNINRAMQRLIRVNRITRQ